MGTVINVDFAALRAKRSQQSAPKPFEPTGCMQSEMLLLCDRYLSEEEKTELMAAIEDFGCYTEADPLVQLLVDIYQTMEKI